jgi:hypothetical protein
MGSRPLVRYDLDLLEVSKMKKVRCTVIWLVLLGFLAACTLSGCKEKAEETGTGGTGTETSQGEAADPNA